MNFSVRQAHLNAKGWPPEETDRILEITLHSPEAARWTRKTIEKLGAPGEWAWVIESEGRIEGYLVVRMVMDEAEILNLAVEQTERRQGRGTALLQESLTELEKSGVRQVFLEVRESNAPAIAFYSKHGFEMFGKRSGYYRDPEEAALCMKKKLMGQDQVPT
ncbi:MAG: ribosomal protein S18-alanine N-acetyltransferase [Candidatus Acidiferrum sp.]